MFLQQINLKNHQEKSVILSTNWSKDTVKLTIITENLEVFEGAISFEHFGEVAALLDKNEAEFFIENKNYLTVDAAKVNFEIKDSTFTWFKQIEDVKVKYGICELKSVESNKGTIFNILSNISLTFTDLSAENQKVKEELSKSKEEAKELQTGFEQILQEKNKAEEELFTKFYCLLNSKKELIANLKKEDD